MHISLNKISDIYNSIVDDYSKQLFENRLMLSISDSPYYARKIIESTKPGIALLNKISKKRIWIYGCGLRGQRFASMYRELNILGFLDRKESKPYLDIPVINPADVTVGQNDLIVVSPIKGANNIVDYLHKDLKIKKSQIITLKEYDEKFNDLIYFDKRCIICMPPSDGIFIDAGAFDGTDSINFINSSLYRNNEILAFDPDPDNCDIIKKRLKGFKQIAIFNKGLSNEESTISFVKGEGIGSHFADKGNCLIETNTLDEICKMTHVGYIKMDIEGDEKKALIGAEKTIKRDKPNLMISVYHKKNDIIEIPSLILRFNKKYNFLLGHYKVGSVTDTVLYAFVERT